MFETGDLIAKAKLGNQKAREKLYKEYFRSLYTFVRHKVKTNEDAEDLVAESFIKAFKNIEGFTGKSTFKTWLYTIARNNISDLYRRKKVEMDSMGLDLENYGEEIEIKGENLGNEANVRKVLSKLPENYRQVLELRYLLNCSLKEAAEIMDTTVGNIKVLQNRAIKKAKMLDPNKLYPETSSG